MLKVVEPPIAQEIIGLILTITVRELFKARKKKAVLEVCRSEFVEYRSIQPCTIALVVFCTLVFAYLMFRPDRIV